MLFHFRDVAALFDSQIKLFINALLMHFHFLIRNFSLFEFHFPNMSRQTVKVQFEI